MKKNYFYFYVIRGCYTRPNHKGLKAQTGGLSPRESMHMSYLPIELIPKAIKNFYLLYNTNKS